MLIKYKITYKAHRGEKRTVEISATSKYNAKQRFFVMFPSFEIERIEVAE